MTGREPRLSRPVGILVIVASVAPGGVSVDHVLIHPTFIVLQETPGVLKSHAAR